MISAEELMKVSAAKGKAWPILAQYGPLVSVTVGTKDSKTCLVALYAAQPDKAPPATFEGWEVMVKVKESPVINKEGTRAERFIRHMLNTTKDQFDPSAMLPDGAPPRLKSMFAEQWKKEVEPQVTAAITKRFDTITDAEKDMILEIIEHPNYERCQAIVQSVISTAVADIKPMVDKALTTALTSLLKTGGLPNVNTGGPGDTPEIKDFDQ